MHSVDAEIAYVLHQTRALPCLAPHLCWAFKSSPSMGALAKKDGGKFGCSAFCIQFASLPKQWRVQGLDAAACWQAVVAQARAMRTKTLQRQKQQIEICCFKGSW